MTGPVPQSGWSFGLFVIGRGPVFAICTCDSSVFGGHYRDCEGEQILFFHNRENIFWEKTCSASAPPIIGSGEGIFFKRMNTEFYLMHQMLEKFCTSNRLLDLF